MTKIRRGDFERTHVLEAIARMQCGGVPPRRGSRGYCLVYRSRHYPVKYAVELAYRIATGREGDWTAEGGWVTGGRVCVDMLERVGFESMECGCGGLSPVSRPEFP